MCPLNIVAPHQIDNHKVVRREAGVEHQKVEPVGSAPRRGMDGGWLTRHGVVDDVIDNVQGIQLEVP